MQTLTFCEQQLQGGATHSVVWIGGGGQQQRLPASATFAEPVHNAAATTVAANQEKRNIMFSPLKVNQKRLYGTTNDVHAEPLTSSSLS
jgi:hypothetical protein